HPLVGAEGSPVLMHYVRVPSSLEAVKNNLTVFVEVTHSLPWFYCEILTVDPKHREDLLKSGTSCNSVQPFLFHFSSGISNHYCRQLLDCGPRKTTVNKD
ncbi:hypothetical protein EMCRGX_G005449, partial [Ephydatia muelleri]